MDKFSYVYETLSNDSKSEHEYDLKVETLDKDQSIKYVINEKEFELANELLSYNSDKELMSYINKIRKEVRSFPFSLKLIGNEEFDVHDKFQLLQTKLITNTLQENLLDNLISELNTCDSFDIIVSFIKNSGFNCLLNTLEELEKKGIQGRIITTTYMSVTDSDSLRKLLNYKNLKVKIYESKEIKDSFHTKAYIFKRNSFKNISTMSSVIIGSSNISETALKTGEEWNIRTYERSSDNIYQDMNQRFEYLWNHEKTVELCETYIVEYEKFIKEKNVLNPFFYTFNSRYKDNDNNEIKPNSMQKEALINFQKLLDERKNKGLIIAATGSGKTLLSAWCAKQMKANKVLFIAHSEELVKGAFKSFKKVFREVDDKNFGLYVGEYNEIKPFTFASIQKFNNNKEIFKELNYDLVVIDEFHHAAAKSYRSLLKMLTPKFLLGLTATPERTDGENIYSLVDNNVIIDIRLRDALEHELLVPFQYYGISDDFVDLSNVNKFSDKEILAALLKRNNERVDFIINSLNKFAIQGKRKCIAFSQSVEHAEKLSEAFNKQGYKSICLTGKNKPEERSFYIKKLQDEGDDLEFIFTVDLFNEGVDIPEINLILFLRPTKSPIIFTQQLGRGLRKHETKEILIVLDFVTNDFNNYLIPIALIGEKYIKDKAEIKAQVRSGFNDISKYIHVELDKKSKHRILKSLDSFEPFNKKNIIIELNDFLLQLRNSEEAMQDHKLNILDFLNTNDAPNIDFIMKRKDLPNISVINKVLENERDVDKKINKKEEYIKILNSISAFLPLRRIIDFIVLTETYLNNQVSYSDVVNYLEANFSIQINDILERKIKLSIERMSKIDIKINNEPLLKFEKDNLILKNTIRLDDDIKEEIKSYQDYGVLTYKKDQNIEKMLTGFPFEINKSYYTIDLANIMRMNAKSAEWMTGFKSEGHHHFIMVTIIKDKSKYAIKQDYQDYFINNELFHWESSNSKTATSTVKKALESNDPNKKYHLFIRREQKNIFVQPYKYYGEVDFISKEGDLPMNIIWKLKNPISNATLEEYRIENN
ncbi:DUF3427 domain-containing protein [Macrococcoides canis]|uniref:DUF3427 domain-containing protein n=2 Tax=Macrococcoides canis TaxID=1855823 RepID=A0A4R6C8C2_9STAP|nr:DUF3427 domain-containing protein [Macrococcus canis]TDM18678.1 DUF3427 domain-containing protein [Macrococcus canis]